MTTDTRAALIQSFNRALAARIAADANYAADGSLDVAGGVAVASAWAAYFEAVDALLDAARDEAEGAFAARCTAYRCLAERARGFGCIHHASDEECQASFADADARHTAAQLRCASLGL